MASAGVSLDRSLLPRVARAMSTSLGLGDVLAAASRAAAELVPDSLVLIWVQQNDRLVLRAAAGTLEHPWTGLPTTLAVGEGLAGAAGLAHDVVLVEEPGADPRARYPSLLHAEGVRTFVGVPLAARHARVGVLAVYSRRPRRPSPGRWTRSASSPRKRRSPSRARGSSPTPSGGGAARRRWPR